MAITDRLMNFLKVELNDFLGTYKDEDLKSTPKKDQDWTDKFYDFFNGTSAQTESNTQQQAQDSWQQRQQRKSRHYSSQQNTSDSQSSSWQQETSNTVSDSKYYDALEIKPGASLEEIKQAYRQVMKKYHPDRFASNPEKRRYAEQLAQKINEAYEYLKKKHA